ncbi:oxidoreductase [Bacillus sp. JJ1764]|uniref:oxidoreductase n=1 Tax=Bacillus sp. JJ1764 TaxID=3122964 RepID=UPI002FFE1615
MTRRAVVAGATGLVGKQLVQLLLNDPEYYEITLLVRRSTGITHPKIHERIVDFDYLDREILNLKDADVFCTLGTTIKKAGSQEAFRKVDYVYPLALGKLAQEQIAKQFLLITSMGANPSSSTFYIRVKGEVEQALRKLNLPVLHIFRPSLLLGDREKFRFGERFAAITSGLLSPMFFGPLRKYKPVYDRTVAMAMLQVAKSDLQGVHVHESSQIVEVGQ